MATDFLEQLAEQDVPDAPQELRAGVHERLNEMLLGLHVLEFAVLALPAAAVEFSRAVGGWLFYTLAGRFRSLPKDEPPEK